MKKWQEIVIIVVAAFMIGLCAYLVWEDLGRDSYPRPIKYEKGVKI